MYACYSPGYLYHVQSKTSLFYGPNILLNVAYIQKKKKAKGKAITPHEEEEERYLRFVSLLNAEAYELLSLIHTNRPMSHT